MATTNHIETINTDAINAVIEPQESKSMSIESMALLINAERLKTLENTISNEFVELKKRQDQVSHLHKVIKAINSATTDKEEFDCSGNEDLKALLKKAKEHGVDIKEDKFKYTKQERDRLLENIRITADEMNVLNDMQLQSITRMTTERYESYQLARSIMKPLHEDKINKARAIAGR